MGSPAGARAAVARVLPAVRADIERLVRIPSVPSDASAPARLRESADEVASQLRAAGVTVFVEGEEEIGSPTLSQLLAAHRTGSRPTPSSSPTPPTGRSVFPP